VCPSSSACEHQDASHTGGCGEHRVKLRQGGRVKLHSGDPSTSHQTYWHLPYPGVGLFGYQEHIKGFLQNYCNLLYKIR